MLVSLPKLISFFVQWKDIILTAEQRLSTVKFIRRIAGGSSSNFMTNRRRFTWRIADDSLSHNMMKYIS
jgi:hypothetical protein